MFLNDVPQTTGKYVDVKVAVLIAFFINSAGTSCSVNNNSIISSSKSASDSAKEERIKCASSFKCSGISISFMFSSTLPSNS
ncbi:Uncharacterised protein [Chlamydia trachomatis]|nr:Uncharacterised protein [Chlamydia trachomatis]